MVFVTLIIIAFHDRVSFGADKKRLYSILFICCFNLGDVIGVL